MIHRYHCIPDLSV